jgi:hypothetical protein
VSLRLESGSMKRKAAPSILWKNSKIPRLEGDLAVSGLKDVNHLERFSLQKLQTVIKQEDKENHNNQETAHDMQTIEKNYLLTSPQSKEVCFAVQYKSLKTAPNNMSAEGLLVVFYHWCTLYNMDGKSVASAELTREKVEGDFDDHHECSQEVRIKNKLVYFWPGNIVHIGSKEVKVHKILHKSSLCFDRLMVPRVRLNFALMRKSTAAAPFFLKQPMKLQSTTHSTELQSAGGTQIFFSHCDTKRQISLLIDSSTLFFKG